MTERIRTLLDLIRDHVIVRRLVLLAAVVMTWRVSVWGVGLGTAWIHMADHRPPGMELAAIIAAATAPLTLFTGAVFRAYVEGRSAK